MSSAAREKAPQPSVLSLAQLLEQQPPTAPPCLVEPGLLPPQGILFVGGEPKVGKSLLVANLALSLAAGADRTGFPIPAPRRVLVCQFELPLPQFVTRLATMRRVMGNAADQNLFVDTRYRPSAQRASGLESLPLRRPRRRRGDHRLGPALLHARSR